MTKEIQLTQEEQEIFDTLEDSIKKCRDHLKKSRIPPKNISSIIEENAKLCVKLHMSLKKRGTPPVHS